MEYHEITEAVPVNSIATGDSTITQLSKFAMRKISQLNYNKFFVSCQGYKSLESLLTIQIQEYKNVARSKRCRHKNFAATVHV